MLMMIFLKWSRNVEIVCMRILDVVRVVLVVSSILK